VIRWLALRGTGRYRVPMMLHPIVVFDLDGTLVDTAPDLVATLNTILAREGLPPVAYDDARNMVGGGARMMLERGLAAEGRTLPASEVDRLLQDFIAHYGDHIADASGPFQGVETALDELTHSGCRLAVCTNKLQGLSLRLLDLLGLSPRFAAICGPDTFGVSKPDPEILRKTIERAAETSAERSWWEIPAPMSPPPARPMFRSSPSTSAIPRSLWPSLRPIG
jgi:phosphoglycolate phosphatase